MSEIKGDYAFDYPKRIAEGENKGKKIQVYVYTLGGEQALLKQYQEKQEKTLDREGKPVFRQSPSGAPYFYSTRPLGDTMNFGFAKNGNLFAETPAEVSSLLDLAKEHEGTKTGDILSAQAAGAISKHFVITRRRTPQQVGAPVGAVVDNANLGG
jgi:hypothetical protein